MGCLVAAVFHIIDLERSLYGGTLPRDLRLNYSGETSWDAPTGTLRFLSSGTMPECLEDFFWIVPKQVKQIEIGANVTFTGGFRIRYRDIANPLTIVGQDRKTSVIHGTDQQAWAVKAKIAEGDKWHYGAISTSDDAIKIYHDITIGNVTIEPTPQRRCTSVRLA